MLNVYPAQTTPVIDTYHDLIHKGKYFSGGYYNSALAAAGTLDILIQASSAHYTHAQFVASASGDCTVQLYEDTTFSAAGTAVDMSNHNRSSASVFSGTVTHTPTVTSVGTAINGMMLLPGGTKHSGGGADAGFNNEFVLDKSTNYLLRVTNVSGITIKISAMIEAVQGTL